MDLKLNGEGMMIEDVVVANVVNFDIGPTSNEAAGRDDYRVYFDFVVTV